MVAHCLLNPLTRVRGLEPLDISIAGPTVQLPCPEALYLGLERWAVTRNQLDVPEHRRFCRSLIVQYADLLQMLAKEGARVRIVDVVGIPELRRCHDELWLRGWSGARVRARACARTGDIHGGADWGAGEARHYLR